MSSSGDGRDGAIYNYDANGNLISGGGRTYTYNLENKPLTISHNGETTSFVYDGDGGRVKKIAGTTTTRYIDRFYECDNTSCTRFIFAGDTRIASVAVTTGAVHYWHQDHLGSSSVITDGTGALVQTLTYYPYGETRTNESSATPTVDVPYKYTDQELDNETGLYNYNARLYDAEIGRFISPDSIVQNYTDPQTLNRYSYARNSPLLYTDPSGHIFGIDDILIGVAIGAILRGTTSAVTGGDFLQGMAIGAVTGGFMGGASAITSGIAATAEQAALIYGLAGGGAGATSSAMTRSDIGMGALTGSVFGAASSFGTPSFRPFGNMEWGSIGNRLFNSALTGSVFGATYAGITGGEIGRAAMWGAVGWAAGEAANMAIGHAYGYIASDMTKPTFNDGVFVYNVDTPGLVTFGNVIAGPEIQLGDPLYRDKQLVPGKTIRDHEVGHMPQGTQFGLAYIPAHAASLTVGGAVGFINGTGFIDGSHRFGLLERYYHPVPQW